MAQTPTLHYLPAAVDNPFADRRFASDWRHAEQFPRGVYLRDSHGIAYVPPTLTPSRALIDPDTAPEPLHELMPARGAIAFQTLAAALQRYEPQAPVARAAAALILLIHRGDIQDLGALLRWLDANFEGTALYALADALEHVAQSPAVERETQ